MNPPVTGTKLGAGVGLVKMILRRRPDFDRWEADRGHPLLSHPQLAADNPQWIATTEQQQLAVLESLATTASLSPRLAGAVPH